MFTPDQAVALDPVEFAAMVEMTDKIFEADDLKGFSVVSLPENESKVLREASVEVARFVFGQCRNDRVKYDSFMARWRAWRSLSQSGTLMRAFPKHDPDEVRLFALALASWFPLTPRARFDEIELLITLVEQLPQPPIPP